MKRSGVQQLVVSVQEHVSSHGLHAKENNHLFVLFFLIDSFAQSLRMGFEKFRHGAWPGCCILALSPGR